MNTSSRRRRAIGLICSTILMMSLCSRGYGQSALICTDRSAINWNEIRKAFVAFVNDPSPPKGSSLVGALPGDPARDTSEPGERLKTVNLIVNPIGDSRFRAIALEGNKYAVEAVFRLLNITDGAHAEMLLMLLGDIVRLHPKLFLEVLYRYKDMETFRFAGYPVKMNKFNMGSPARRHELWSRIEALESVKEEYLQELRDACISELRAALKISRK